MRGMYEKEDGIDKSRNDVRYHGDYEQELSQVFGTPSSLEVLGPIEEHGSGNT